MPGPPQSARQDSLCKLWRRWSAVIEKFARGAKPRITQKEYHTLHVELIDACRANRALREAHDDQLETLARPWFCLDALAHTEREILLHLLAQCWQIERELGGRRWTSRFKLLGLVLLVLAIGIGTWLWAGGWLQEWLHVLWVYVKQSSTSQRLLAVGIVVTLLATYFVVRVDGTY